MMTNKHKAFLAVIALGSVLGGGVASADAPPQDPAGKSYECSALASASSDQGQSALAAEGLDPAQVTGPVGLMCGAGQRAAQDGFEAKLAGIEGIAYTCTKAEEKKLGIVVFSECKA
ncbi:hypothetical protein GCM10009660_29070 [Catellatospora bangladeshensis]